MFDKLLNKIVMSFIAGAVLPCAFAPISYWVVSFLSPAALLYIWQRDHFKNAALLGWSFGLGAFGVGTSWIFVSIHTYGQTHWGLAGLITGLFIVFMALFPALQGKLLKTFYLHNPVSAALIGFPSSWVLVEVLRSWALTGFPWLLLGNTQVDTWLNGFAPITSVYGLSFLTCFLGAALTVLLTSKLNQKSRACIIALSLTITVSGYYLQSHEWTKADGSQVVALIQGNLSPDSKFAQEFPIKSTWDTYGRLSQPVWAQADVVVWPEGAIPVPNTYATTFIASLEALTQKHQTTLITGIPFTHPDIPGKYYNGLITLGLGKGEYFKRRLVPFGDYVPFEEYLRGLIGFFDLPMSSFIQGPNKQPQIMLPNSQLTPLICYEIAYANLARETSREGQAILTLSEDGWFGRSFGPHQHLEIAQMRALENERYVIRATTSGYTAVINHQGKIVNIVDPFLEKVLVGQYVNRLGQTPWQQTGPIPWLLLVGLLFIVGSRVRFTGS